MIDRYAYPAAAANGAGPAVAVEVMENVPRTAHRATITPKGKYKRFRTHPNRFGTGVHVVWGVKPKSARGPRGGRVYVHAIMFDRKKFTPAEAKRWLKAHDFVARRFEAAKPKLKLPKRKKKAVKRAANMLPEATMFQYVASMNPVEWMKVWQKAHGYPRKKTKANPSLMILSNPRRNKLERAAPKDLSNEVRLAQKAYKSFHFKDSQKHQKRKVPDGWPKVYVVLGDVDAFEVKGSTGKVKRRYGARKPVLACTKDRKDVFIFSRSGKLGLPSGTAVRVDYSVPNHSGRLKWAKSWYHPHDSNPKVRVHKNGTALRISGPGLSVTPRGIIG